MPPMVSALGVDIRRLFMIVFGFGTMLAGFAGIMIAPILSVEPGMGDTILILAFVVIVIGGIGSIRGAFLAALLIGLVDTLGRSFAVDILRLFLAPSPARTVGPAHRLDADLSADGRRALRPARRPVPREGALTWRTPRRRSSSTRAPRGLFAGNALPVAIFLVFALVPLFATFRAEAYVLSLVTRVMIFAIAALALDLLIGYGALVSFGHAAFIGLGAYAVGILSSHGINDALISLPVALGVSALFALADRHRVPAHQGRLLHHDHAGVRPDGVLHRELARALWRRRRPDHPRALDARGLSDLLPATARSITSASICLLGTYLLCRALVASRFGRVYRGARENPLRIATIGFEVYRYQLVAYVIAGALGGLSGFLLGNATEFVSPAYMSWQRSGELLIMVIFGGIGTLNGAIVGAAAFLLVEEWLSGITEHWKVIFGPLLVLVAVFAPRRAARPRRTGCGG